MKKLAVLCLLFGLELGSVLPALAITAGGDEQVQKEEQVAPEQAKYARARCFKEKKGTIEVPYNLSPVQKDFLTRARFSSKEALQNYIVLNSINNTMAVCLKKGFDVEGFNRKRTGRNSFKYFSKKTNVTLVQGSEKTIIQGAVVIKVKFPPRGGKPTIESMRTA